MSAGKPGYYQGGHFTEYIERVKELKRAKRLDEVESLLLNLVEATEAENSIDKRGVAPWYYEQLAIIYKGQKKYRSEVSILERFAQQKHAPGPSPAKLLKRLEKAKVVLKDSEQ